jgi:hypothetical protein
LDSAGPSRLRSVRTRPPGSARWGCRLARDWRTNGTLGALGKRGRRSSSPPRGRAPSDGSRRARPKRCALSGTRLRSATPTPRAAGPQSIRTRVRRAARLEKTARRSGPNRTAAEAKGFRGHNRRRDEMRGAAAAGTCRPVSSPKWRKLSGELHSAGVSAVVQWIVAALRTVYEAVPGVHRVSLSGFDDVLIAARANVIRSHEDATELVVRTHATPGTTGFPSRRNPGEPPKSALGRTPFEPGVGSPGLDASKLAPADTRAPADTGQCAAEQRCPCSESWLAPERSGGVGDWAAA